MNESLEDVDLADMFLVLEICRDTDDAEDLGLKIYLRKRCSNIIKLSKYCNIIFMLFLKLRAVHFTCRKF